MKRYQVGDAITYRAEIFRIAGNKILRLERQGHGYIVHIVNDELLQVNNGIRVVLVRREDVVKNHSFP